MFYRWQALTISHDPKRREKKRRTTKTKAKMKIHRNLCLVLMLCCWCCQTNGKSITNEYPTDGEDGYVVEDMSLIQNDQPFAYASGRKSFAPERIEHKPRVHMPPNLLFTKEVVVKQGRLKGFVRVMHAQTGLKNVDQYLGIPYAAAPTGNGRFMPPGTCLVFRTKTSFQSHEISRPRGNSCFRR